MTDARGVVTTAVYDDAGQMTGADSPTALAAAAERGMSVDELAAETISAQFGPIRRTLSFAAIGASTSGRTAAEAEQLLEEGAFGIDSADR